MSDQSFQNLDFGLSRPTTAPYDTIKSIVDPSIIVDSYAHAIKLEMERMNPLTWERVPVTDEELKNYLRFLLYQRVAQVNDRCTIWRKLKNLWIPTFVQYVLTTIGVVEIEEYGLRIVPSCDFEPISVEDAMVISDKIAYYKQELAMVKDAMPRDLVGDRDTMSTVLIADYMRGLKKVEHPVSVYTAAFLGLRLEEDTAFSVLYRVRYDDIATIRHCLLTSHEVRGTNGTA